MFDELYKDVKREVSEGMYELIPETPGIPPEDQELLRKAMADGIISPVTPPYGDMMEELIPAMGWEQIDLLGDDANITPDTKFLDRADIAGMYLKNILLPIAKGERPSKPAKIRVRDLDPTQQSTIEQVLFELFEDYTDLLSPGQGRIVPVTQWADSVATALAADITSGNLPSIVFDFDEEQEEAMSLLSRLGPIDLKQVIYSVATDAYADLKGLL